MVTGEREKNRKRRITWAYIACHALSTLSLLCGLLGPAAVHAERLAPAGTGTHLWVDAVHGDDTHGGGSASTAFRTIQRAADEAGPGTTIHILPGVYRESVRPTVDGTSLAPIVFLAEAGPGTVVVRGSDPSSSVSWSRLTFDPIGLPDGVDSADIFYADVGNWDLDSSPRFIVRLDGEGEVETRLPLAREPDWHVVTDWRYQELWWTADGGSEVAQCDPSDPDQHWNCDLRSRCEKQLTDRNVFAEPDPRIEPGNLATLDDVTGARLIALDAKWGHYVYDRRILSHDVQAGRITVEGHCLQDGGKSDPGLGWGTKYYVQDHPALLDSPGEWWYDGSTGRLYLWPPTDVDPAALNIEISRRDAGFDLTNRSHVTLDGVTVELVNGAAIQYGWPYPEHEGDVPNMVGNTVRNATLRYADFGVVVRQAGAGVARDFTLEDSEIAHIDTNGLFITEWWEGAPTPTSDWEPSTGNIVIRGNQFRHLGFRANANTDDPIGIKIQFANELTFEDNLVQDVAHNGLQFLWSVIDSSKTYDFAPSEIKTGRILVKDNVFEDVCQLTTDCGALKFWGQSPDNHVFRDVLVTGNVFRDNAGWTYVGEQREGWWAGGDSCEVQGQAGFGLYLDYASGIHAYRNVAYNNAYAGFMLVGTWRDGDVILYNNVLANSLYGIRLVCAEQETHVGSVNTQIVNNAIVGNEGYGIYHCTAGKGFGSATIDHNLYYNDGWRSWDDGGVWKPGAVRIDEPGEPHYYQTLSEIQEGLPPWETHGVEGDPAFQRYDPDDHDLHDGSWPDFHLTSASQKPIDGGADLPMSLTSLLNAFGVVDLEAGEGRDIGRYEAGFWLRATPSTQVVKPCGTAEYAVRLDPDDLAVPVDLAVTTSDSRVTASLDRSTITAGQVAALRVSDTTCGRTPSASGGTVTVTGTAGGLTDTATVGLLVGGREIYLPCVLQASR